MPEMMKLHWSPRTPYVRKVMVVAPELGLMERLERVRTVVGGTAPHLELMRENPVGKMPTLMLRDGTITAGRCKPFTPGRRRSSACQLTASRTTPARPLDPSASRN